MKLRRSFSSHQLIFALGLSLFAHLEADAQDKVTTNDGRVQIVKVLGVAGSNLQVQVGAGSIGLPMATIRSVEMPIPSEFTAGKAAFDAQDFAKSLQPIKTVVEKFKGLPTVWARQAASMLGDIYVTLNKLPEAEAAYQDFQKAYPGQGSVQTDVGLARIAVSKKDYATAKAKLEPITADALKEKHAPTDKAAAYSQAFFLLGQVNEAQQDYPTALENYLRTVTLFPADRAAVNGAKEKADALRKDHGITVP